MPHFETQNIELFTRDFLLLINPNADQADDFLLHVLFLAGDFPDSTFRTHCTPTQNPDWDVAFIWHVFTGDNGADVLEYRGADSTHN